MGSRAVDVRHAESQLQELVDQASRGEEVILTQRGEPVARIIPIVRRVPRRRFGSATGMIRMREDFDEPLEDFSAYS
jgi:prevent-host-death family protein